MSAINELRSELNEVTREIRVTLESLERTARASREKGYDFAGPNVNLFTTIMQLEIRRNTLTRIIKTLDTENGK